ncbi:hypothetical protein KR222_006217 [Zaprionus bogoriensis]|nr:hypothetical protein KR222_006217 [Zaprionus bogoriensis]
MLPQLEHPAAIPDTFATPQREYCEESRCNQLQTAEQVYHRILERLQRQPRSTHSTDEATLKQIWLASFTGSQIYYRA